MKFKNDFAIMTNDKIFLLLKKKESLDFSKTCFQTKKFRHKILLSKIKKIILQLIFNCVIKK